MKFIARRLAVKALAAAIAIGCLSVAAVQDAKRAKLGHRSPMRTRAPSR